VSGPAGCGIEDLGAITEDVRVLEQSRSEQDQNIVGRGFTLVELLIVIVILGILAGIVVFAVGNLTSSAKGNACGAEKSTLITADEAYKAQTGSYTDTTGLLASGLLKATPTMYNIDSAGTVTAVSGNANGCT
jgi:prepilin-type N-terminal cleavage/methylation domain-containing protein